MLNSKVTPAVIPAVAPAVIASKNDTNIPPRQYQNHGQQQRQKDSNTTMNSHASTNSRSLDPNRKKLQNHVNISLDPDPNSF